ETAVDAIHPGYGLLSENAEFVHQCEDAGIIFIGPKAEVMQQMGDKITAWQIMEKAAAPATPGPSAAVAADTDNNEACSIGYPLVLKASAGGGGIGMQVVHSEEELEKGFAGNSRRAEQFFGVGTMFLEKYIETSRHIEIQVVADQHGNVVHLFER